MTKDTKADIKKEDERNLWWVTDICHLNGLGDRGDYKKTKVEKRLSTKSVPQPGLCLIKITA